MPAARNGYLAFVVAHRAFAKLNPGVFETSIMSSVRKYAFDSFTG